MNEIIPFKKNDIIELKIESLTNGGEGIAKIDNYPFFVPDSVSGDHLKAKIITVNKSYGRALIVDIIKGSPQRVDLPCEYFNDCGGCQWMHISYPEQLQSKTEIVRDTLKRIGKIETNVLPCVENSQLSGFRCKIQLPVQQNENGDFLIGYYKKRSHHLIDIPHCMIQAKIINEIVDFLRMQFRDLNFKAYNETNGRGWIRHVIFRYSSTKENLILIIVINDNKITENLKKLSESLQNKFPEIIGILANFNQKKTNVIMGRQTQVISGKDHIIETLNRKPFKISAASFFQVNPGVAEKIFDAVYEYISSRFKKPRVLDLYAGVGTFSLWLAEIAEEVLTIEDSFSSVEDQIENIKLSNFQDKMKTIKGDAEKEIIKLKNEGKVFEAVVIDPPRKGCSQAVLDSIIQLKPELIVYVSCNPSTLARDLQYLLERDYDLDYVQPYDMFSYSYHIESVAFMKKKS